MGEAKKIVIVSLKSALKYKIEAISQEYSEYAIAIGLDLFKVDEELIALVEDNNTKKYFISVSEISKKYVNVPFCVNINCKNLNEFKSVEDNFKVLTQGRFLFVSSENKKILKYIKSNYESVMVFMTAFDIAIFYFFTEIGFDFLLKKMKGDAVLIPERSGLINFSRNSFVSKLKEFNKSIFIYTDRSIKNIDYDYVSGYYLMIS